MEHASGPSPDRSVDAGHDALRPGGVPRADETDNPDTHWYRAFIELTERGHRCTGDEVLPEVNASIRHLGLTAMIYLVDHQQQHLRPVQTRDGGGSPLLPIDDGPAGRAFSSVSVVPDRNTLWIALVDGAERLGVVAIDLDERAKATPDLQKRCVSLVSYIGHLVASKVAYGDFLPVTRRSQPMTPAAELLLKLMPPLTFSAKQMVVSAVLEPVYDCGGDAFDYAVDGPLARVTVLDAMGRGLNAGLTTATALAALRAGRRAGGSLEAMARDADRALTGQFDDLRFVTGILAELDLDTGRLRYVNAGHPEPLLMRGEKVIRTLDGGRRLPLGIPGDVFEVGEDALLPEDRLLFYTDGVVEAPGADGRPFGLDRLVELAQQAAFAGLPAPETLRLLAHSVRRHQADPPHDDATLLLVEWSAAATRRTSP
jgi:hypothetical protein